MGAGAPARVRSRVARPREGPPLSRRTICLCLGLAAPLALTAALLLAGVGEDGSGTASAAGTPAPSRADVADLEGRARWHARRLGLQEPARRPPPRSERRLARRAAELRNVVAFLRGQRELAPSIGRPAALTAAPAASPPPGYRRAARESARLGIAPPPPPSVAAPEARAAQAERWGDVATWLARRGERRRPAEVNATAAAVAMEQRGTPYVYGGGGPGGFDCSGLASYAFARAGKALPHNTNAIWGTLPKVPRGALRPGDMVFFSGLGHMGIYVGDGRFVHAPRTGEVVRVETLADRDDYVGAVRA